ncbi:unnamed protein product [Chrysoparadoxa australica]
MKLFWAPFLCMGLAEEAFAWRGEELMSVVQEACRGDFERLCTRRPQWQEPVPPSFSESDDMVQEIDEDNFQEIDEDDFKEIDEEQQEQEEGEDLPTFRAVDLPTFVDVRMITERWAKKGDFHRMEASRVVDRLPLGMGCAKADACLRDHRMDLSPRCDAAISMLQAERAILAAEPEPHGRKHHQRPPRFHDFHNSSSDDWDDFLVYDLRPPVIAGWALLLFFTMGTIGMFRTFRSRRRAARARQALQARDQEMEWFTGVDSNGQPYLIHGVRVERSPHTLATLHVAPAPASAPAADLRQPLLVPGTRTAHVIPNSSSQV